MTANDWLIEGIQESHSKAKEHVRKMLEREEKKRKSLMDGSHDRLMQNRKHQEIYYLVRKLIEVLR